MSPPVIRRALETFLELCEGSKRLTLQGSGNPVKKDEAHCPVEGAPLGLATFCRAHREL